MSKRNISIKLAIAVPTYNESKNIKKLVSGIKKNVAKAGVPCTLLIVDDNSPDGTGDTADTLAKSEKTKDFNVQVLHRTEKDGFGRAYVAGFKQLLKKDFTHIMQMDADLSHDPKYLIEFVAALEDEKVDFVVGSRYIKGGDTPDWSTSRKLLSKFGNIYARLFLGSRIHDYTGGFNLYSKKLLGVLDLDSLQAGGYGFLIELKYKALSHCRSVREVPIVFMDRRHGNSKMPKSTIVKNLLLVPSLALKDDNGS